MSVQMHVYGRRAFEHSSAYMNVNPALKTFTSKHNNSEFLGT